MDEAERLLEMRKASQDATNEDNDNREQECDRESSGEEDLTPSWSIGPTRSFLF